MKMERGQQRIDREVSSSFHHVEIWELSLKGKKKKVFASSSTKKWVKWESVRKLVQWPSKDYGLFDINIGIQFVV